MGEGLRRYRGSGHGQAADGGFAVSATLAIILAAGKSTRMKSDRPKVLHDICGRPMVAYVIDAAREAGAGRVLLVVGHGHEQVREALADEPGVEFVLQAEQGGTGHAVGVCRSAVGEHDGAVLILCGDSPLVRGETLGQLVRKREESGAACVLGTAILPDPTGYGRIVRNTEGDIQEIVEHKDATPDQRAITEVNPSTYVFGRRELFESLEAVRPNNVQGEYYLTDCVKILLAGGQGVLAEPCLTPPEAMGINHRGQLAEVVGLMQQAIQEQWMLEGVTIVDPRSTYIDARAKIGGETVIQPFTVIAGPVQIGRGCRIGPSAHLRGETVLEDEVEVGSFVEVVRSRLGKGTRAKHLTYLGDARVGPGVNLGAGTITANFDGADKHMTVVEAEANLGAGTILVAPVTVGAAARTGAGTVVLRDRDVAPGSVVVGVPAKPVDGQEP